MTTRYEVAFQTLSRSDQRAARDIEAALARCDSLGDLLPPAFAEGLADALDLDIFLAHRPAQRTDGTWSFGLSSERNRTAVFRPWVFPR